MRRIAGPCFWLPALAVVLVAQPAFSQTFSSGSTGADGAFTLPNAACPTQGTCTVDLPPNGQFNYTTVNVPNGWTVKYRRNATNTPVTMLATGNVTIAGTIDVSAVAGGYGANAIVVAGNGGAGGPGGFDGGTGATSGATSAAGAGRGPGAGTGGVGNWAGGGGAGFFAAGTNGTTYQNSGTVGVAGGQYSDQTLLPLIGGSGGGGGGAAYGWTGGGGGGGGGAIIIASSSTINLTGGRILAAGGNGGTSSASGVGPGAGGAGGAVRAVATTVTGSVATIDVRGGTGGQSTPANYSAGGAGSPGRVRIEAFTNTLSASFPQSQPGVVSSGPPTSVVLANGPSLRITAIGGVAVPASPGASFATPDVVLPSTTTNPVTIGLAAANIPTGAVIFVSVVGQTGGYSSTTSTPLSGTTESSTATATVTVPTTQPCVISASATFAVAALPGQGPLYADGEPVEQIRLVTTNGGRQQVAFITRSGREVPVAAR